MTPLPNILKLCTLICTLKTGSRWTKSNSNRFFFFFPPANKPPAVCVALAVGAAGEWLELELELGLEVGREGFEAGKEDVLEEGVEPDEGGGTSHSSIGHRGFNIAQSVHRFPKSKSQTHPSAKRKKQKKRLTAPNPSNPRNPIRDGPTPPTPPTRSTRDGGNGTVPNV